MIALILALAVTAGDSNGPARNTARVATESPQPRKQPKPQTAIQWEIEPSSVVVYLDKKKLGRAGDLKRTPAKPGRHTVRLVKGKDETEIDIQVTKGQLLRFVLDFSS